MNTMTSLNEIITEIKRGEEAKEEMKKIKEILNNNGTISVVDQITTLQENTSVNNVTLLTSKLTRLQDTLNTIESEYDDLVSALDSAKNELDVDCYGEDDIVTLNREIEDLKDDILTNKEYQEPPAKKTSAKKIPAKKTNPFSNEDKNSLLDVIEDRYPKTIDALAKGTDEIHEAEEKDNQQQ